MTQVIEELIAPLSDVVLEQTEPEQMFLESLKIPPKRGML